MRMHERFVKAALHNGWKVPDPSERGGLTFTRGDERLRIRADERGNVTEAHYARRANWDAPFEVVWVMSATDPRKTDSVLLQLERPVDE
jgi:hypothetical protein